MKLPTIILACTASALLCSGGLFARQVTTDYDRGANFAQYNTYSWKDVTTSSPLLTSRIENAVNAALEAKGWRLVPSGGDMAIVATDMNRNQAILNTFYDGFGGGGWRRRGFGGGFGMSTTTVDHYKVGTLVVDLFNAHDNALMWRGVVSDRLSNNSGKNIKKLDKDVQKMFAHFPPKA